MPIYNGKLNTNEIYASMFNMIISQDILSKSISHNYTSLIDSERVDGSLYGDTKLYYAVELGNSVEWEGDAEANKLLQTNRAKDPTCQAITLDKFRMVCLTTDEYLSKRAWGNEYAFMSFQTLLLSLMKDVKKINETSNYNAFIGTLETKAPKGKIEIDVTTAIGSETGEAANRLEAQAIATGIADLFDLMEDINRDYNENGFLRSYSRGDFKIVWNSKFINKIRKFDLPTMFHNEGLIEKFDEFKLPAHYFGEIRTSSGTVQSGEVGKIRSLSEQDYYLTTDTNKTKPIHLFGGQVLPENATYGKNEVYTVDDTIICKIMRKGSVPFMSAFEIGTSFFNPRSLTHNHYLIWGHNTLENIQDYPFIKVVKK